MAVSGRLTGAAILVAAGSGQRLGADVPKAFVPIAGRTLLEHAVTGFATHPLLVETVVVVPSAYVDAARSLLDPHVHVAAGGATRQQSVAAGLFALLPRSQHMLPGGKQSKSPEPATLPGTNGPAFVLVHDVARPFVPGHVIDAVLAALRAGAAAVVPVLPLHDTIRRVGAGGALSGVVDRTSLVAVQTPQGFRRDVLVDAYRHGAAVEATDDAALVEALGGQVVAVPGDEEAFKITTPADLARAEALATRSPHAERIQE